MLGVVHDEEHGLSPEAFESDTDARVLTHTKDVQSAAIVPCDTASLAAVISSVTDATQP